MSKEELIEQLRFALKQLLMAYKEGYYAPKIREDAKRVLQLSEGQK